MTAYRSGSLDYDHQQFMESGTNYYKWIRHKKLLCHTTIYVDNVVAIVLVYIQIRISRVFFKDFLINKNNINFKDFCWMPLKNKCRSFIFSLLRARPRHYRTPLILRLFSSSYSNDFDVEFN